MTHKESIMKMSSCLSGLLLMASLLSLTACGGGGGSDAGLPSSATVIKGVYVGVLNGKEFISIATPTQDWYALYFDRASPIKTDIFSGHLSLGINGLATIQSLRALQENSIHTGVGHLNSGSLKSYQLSVDDITDAAAQSISLKADAPSNFDFSRPAQLSDIQTHWYGRWTDGSLSSGVWTDGTPGLAGGNHLEIASNGSLSTPSGFLNCTLSTTSTMTASTGGNFFDVTLTFGNLGSNICARNGATLSGVAVTYTTTTGTQRLDLIAVNPASGSGISFRAER